MVAAWPWGAYLGEEGMKRGIRVKTSSYTRHHVNITMTQAKAVSNYTNSILANMEALDDGYDEALLLDASGFVSEGAGENMFMVKERRGLHARPVGRRAQRHHPQHDPRDLQRPRPRSWCEKRITRDEVYIADEAFFTGTAAEVTPIRELDRIEIGTRLARPDHREDPERVLRHRQRPQSQVRRMADQGLNAMATGDPRRAPWSSCSPPSCKARAWCSARTRRCRCGATIRASSSTSPPPASGKCPYCGTEYRLKAGEKVHSSH